MYDGLVTLREPPPNRRRGCDGPLEHYLSEGAVIIAFAMHLLRTVPNLKHVAVHPDGEHGKRFDFRRWLEANGFSLQRPMGTTSYGGLYVSKDGKSVLLNPKAGLTDVVADIDGMSFVAECKGGILNTKHSGKQSQLRKGLCEAVGLSLAVPVIKNRRQFAVVPLTKITQELAERLRARASQAGVELALVDARGEVFHV